VCIRPGVNGGPGLKIPDHRAIATSGVSHNSYRLGDRRYHHIIDTSTGQPGSSAVLSVSVLHEDAMWADCWSTTLLATDHHRARELIAQNDLSAILIVAKNGHKIVETFGSASLEDV